MSSASSAPSLKNNHFYIFFFRSEPATSEERCFSSKSLLPVSLTASTLAGKGTFFSNPFSASGFKMDKLDLSQRLYILGKESFLSKSIAYYSDESKVFPDLKEALEADGWEELKNSRLGVFLKFHKMKFGVQPVRFSLHELKEITGLNCEYLNNLENLLVEVTDDMKAFWGQRGVNFDRRPCIDELK
ncbi:hypothetical protein IGI04_034905 [Brassica rapa subsp. trilocularis]|uniref:DUF1985 domain-containing protein n=1 Tax=Brassica rapa subsp. trilocularis TaxID=1813537 RepID=A0ABQ7LC20_BRACM|nr:hypothetical protein IGI04_034905 [Brassica rapa subsp. trilocularis]